MCWHGDEDLDALGSSLGILALRGISRTFLYHGGVLWAPRFFRTPSCHSLLTCKNHVSHKHLPTLFFRFGSQVTTGSWLAGPVFHAYAYKMFMKSWCRQGLTSLQLLQSGDVTPFRDACPCEALWVEGSHTRLGLIPSICRWAGVSKIQQGPQNSFPSTTDASDIHNNKNSPCLLLEGITTFRRGVFWCRNISDSKSIAHQLLGGQTVRKLDFAENYIAIKVILQLCGMYC